MLLNPQVFRRILLVASAFASILLGPARALGDSTSAQPRVVQVSSPDEPEVADPALSIEENGPVTVSGTGGKLVWPSMDAFLTGSRPTRENYRFLEKFGSRLVELKPDELPWDVVEYRDPGGQRELIAGFMTPPEGRIHAKWPDDNVSRRLKRATFDPKRQAWIVDPKPIFGQPNYTEWTGHSYGHDILALSEGKRVIYYEKVSEQAGSPNKTEIFAREIGSAGKFGPERKIAGIDQLAPEATSRVPEIGGFLLEGARVKKYLLASASGKPRDVYILWTNGKDFPTKNYPTYAFVADAPFGPFRPYEESGKVVNFSEKLQKNLKLHGVGRMFPFEYRGQEYVIFHGAKDEAGHEYTAWPKSLKDLRRDLFVAPVSVESEPDGKVRITVSSDR